MDSDAKSAVVCVCIQLNKFFKMCVSAYMYHLHGLLYKLNVS
jgi:hypothetical protein